MKMNNVNDSGKKFSFSLRHFKLHVRKKVIFYCDRKNKYDLGNNNCITFAHQICDFLEVKFEGAHAKLESWLKET